MQKNRHGLTRLKYTGLKYRHYAALESMRHLYDALAVEQPE